MTFTELMSLLNGNYIEVAGTSAKNQCVDLANAYIKYVLGLPAIEFANARDFPVKAGDKYEYILNTPTNAPKEGDLIIWGGDQYGHIAICIEATASRFKSFDENYPTGSPCRMVEHTYPNVMGWLRCKEPPLNYEALFNQAREKRDEYWNMLTSIKDALVITGDFIFKTVLDRIESLLSTERQYGKQLESLSKADEKILDLEEKIKKLEPKHEEIVEDVKDQGQSIQEVKTEVDHLKEEIKMPDWSALKLFWESIKKFLGGITKAFQP